MQSHMYADVGTAKEGPYWNISNTKSDLYLIKPSSRNGSCRGTESQKWNMDYKWLNAILLDLPPEGSVLQPF